MCSSEDTFTLCQAKDSYAPVKDYFTIRCLGATCVTNDESCCENVPPCKYNYGLYRNEEDCFCGLTRCQTEYVMYCTKSQHKCSDGPECTPPLIKNGINITDKEFDVYGCQGSFESVSLASLYARVGGNEPCALYDSEGWASIENSVQCKEVAEIFNYPYIVNLTRGYGCGLDKDGTLYFGRGLDDSLEANYCMRK